VLLLAVLGWSVAMTWLYRATTSLPSASTMVSTRNVKVDGVTFLTAAWMLVHGEARDLYDRRVVTEEWPVETVAPQGGGEPGEVILRRVQAGRDFVAAAGAAGATLHQPAVFVYLPITAGLFVPLLLYPADAALMALDLVNLFAFGAALALFVTVWRPDWRPWRWVAAVLVVIALMSVSSPIAFHLFCGQVSMLVGAAVLLCALPTGGTAWRTASGILVGLVALVKVVPVVLVGLFWMSGRRREAVTMIVTMMALVGGSVLAFGVLLNREAMQAMGDVSEGARVWANNQSTDAFVERMILPVELIAEPAAVQQRPLAAVSVGVELLLLSAWIAALLYCRRRGWSSRREVVAVAATLCLFVLLPPLAWTHYLVFTIPGLVVLVFPKPSNSRGRRWASRLLALPLGVVLWSSPWRLQDLATTLCGAGDSVVRLGAGLPWIATTALFVLLLVELVLDLTAASQDHARGPDGDPSSEHPSARRGSPGRLGKAACTSLVMRDRDPRRLDTGAQPDRGGCLR
jgi:hypothetical protein